MGLRSPGAPQGILAEADLVLAVGYDLIEWEPSVWNRGSTHTIIHLDSTAAELDRSYIPAVEVVGEIGEAQRALADGFAGTLRQWSWQRFRPSTDDTAESSIDDAFPIRPARLMRELRSVLDDDDIVISDVGVHKLWLATHFPAARPNTVVIPNGLASMGLSVPGAVAAKLVHPTSKVVAVTGDGGFMMNSQELETAKRVGTAFVVVVLVDERYGVIELNQKRRFGRTFGVSFQNPDFVAYAASFGLPGFAIKAARELQPTLRRALELDAPCVVAVPVDSSESPSNVLR